MADLRVIICGSEIGKKGKNFNLSCYLNLMSAKIDQNSSYETFFFVICVFKQKFSRHVSSFIFEVSSKKSDTGTLITENDYKFLISGLCIYISEYIFKH